jgi:branched-chain amino acid transport system substrate-binding protein
MNVWRNVLPALWLACVGLSSHAQIVIGQTSGFSGPVAAGVKENTDGAKLYLDAVNAKGGVNGLRIELRSLDDRFEPKVAADNARKLVEDPKVVALVLNRGTPHTEALLPILVESKTPLIGPSTGAMLVHEPVHPFVFNVRATYQRESERAIAHLARIGLTRIALMHVDDSFGTDAAVGAMRGFQAAKLQPAATLKFDRSKPDFAPIASAVVRAETQAVLLVGAGGLVADGLKALRQAGSNAQVVTLSNNAAGGFVKQLGEHARGVIVSQVFPAERTLAVPMIKEAHDLAVKKGLPGVTPAMLEGFAVAKVLVEGLRRAGPAPSRASLTAALNAMNRFDLGGLEIGFSPTDHSGLDYVEPSIIGADGRFLR